jgi:hypothetical protein
MLVRVSIGTPTNLALFIFFFLVHPSKFWDSISVSSQLLPSKSFPIYHTYTILPFRRCVGYESVVKQPPHKHIHTDLQPTHLWVTLQIQFCQTHYRTWTKASSRNKLLRRVSERTSGYGLDVRGVGVRVPIGSRIFSSPRRPDQLWGPPSLLSNGYRWLFLRGESDRGVKLTTHFQLVQRSRKPGSIHPLPHKSSWRSA